MKRYRLWALDVPDLHPDAFQPRLGGMRLFDGGDSGGGGDGPGGSDTRDENTSDYSPSGSGEGGGDPVRAALYGDAGYGQGLTGAQTKAFDDTLAATGDIGQALDAMEAVTSAPAPAPVEFVAVNDPLYGGAYTGFNTAQNYTNLTDYGKDVYAGELALGKSPDAALISAFRAESLNFPTTGNALTTDADAETTENVLATDQTPFTQGDLSPNIGGAVDFTQGAAVTPTGGVASVDLTAGDPTRAALYGDAGYGEGLTGAQTQAFDDTLAATGDVGQALVAMETVAAPAPAPASSSGFTSFGGFGGRGGFSGFGRSRSRFSFAAPALDARTLKGIAQVHGPEVAAQAAQAVEATPPTQAAEAVETPVGIDDSGAGGVNFDAFVNDGTTEGIDAPASASSSADASTGYSYSPSGSGEGTTDTTAPAGTERSTLADAITALRSGNLADALSALRSATGVTKTSEVLPEQAGPPTPSNVVGTGAGGRLVDNEGNPVLSTSYGLPGEYTPPTPQLPEETLAAAARAVGLPVEGLLDSQGLRELPTGEFVKDPTQLSTTGLDYGTLEAMQNAGLGGLEISPTQTVDQALASQQANEFLTEYLPTIIGALGPPGTGAVLSGINTINRLLSGQTTPGQAITTELLGALARQFGISPTVLTNILDGKFGDAAANQTKSLIYGTLAKESGVPGSVLGIAARELGITDAIDPLAAAVDRAVTDVVPDQGFGLPGQVASGIDTVLDPVQEAITSGLGGLGDVLQEAGQGIASGIGTVTTGVGDLIGNLVDAITGGGTESDYVGDGSVGLPGEELGEGILTGVDEWDQALLGADTGGVYTGIDDMVNAGLVGTGTGTVGLPGEELGEGILTGVDSWDQALIDADTGDVYGIGGGDADTGAGAGAGAGAGVDTDGAGGDTDVAPPPPPMIPATGGGTTQMFGNYYSRVPTGYQIVQGPYGPLMQYTYGNVPLGGV